MEKWCIVILLVSLFGKGQTFPNSAPISACIDLVPGHTRSSNDVNPFRIILDRTDYDIGGTVQGKPDFV